MEFEGIITILSFLQKSQSVFRPLGFKSGDRSQSNDRLQKHISLKTPNTVRRSLKVFLTRYMRQTCAILYTMHKEYTKQYIFCFKELLNLYNNMFIVLLIRVSGKKNYVICLCKRNKPNVIR